MINRAAGGVYVALRISATLFPTIHVHSRMKKPRTRRGRVISLGKHPMWRVRRHATPDLRPRRWLGAPTNELIDVLELAAAELDAGDYE